MMRSVPIVGAPQPWPPPPPPAVSTNATDSRTYRNDCTPGICTMSCLQYCGYFSLSPPPPFLLDASDGGDGDDDSSGRISPLMASLIAVLAAAFLLLCYYTVVSRYCRRRQRRRRNAQILNSTGSPDDAEIRLDPMVQDPTRPAGLDESFIRQITVFKYRRSEGLVEGTDCAVCLNEFNEEENLRLMPNCEHAFHIPCIDTWLKSHSSCPLCRATMDPLPARPATNPSTNTNPASNGPVSVAAMQVRSSHNDVVLVVREVDGGIGEEVEVVCHHGEEEQRENGEEEVRKAGVNQR
uniref:RING-type E3 ubiquitin transferase n=1 Tax=Opuntia streptacantha TaxID=393608 RepID=A0A7C9CJD4_OPUST